MTWKYFPYYWPFVILCNAGHWCFLCSKPEQIIEHQSSCWCIGMPWSSWDVIVRTMSGECQTYQGHKTIYRCDFVQQYRNPYCKDKMILWSPQKEFLHLQYDILNWNLAEKLSHKVKLEPNEICIRQQDCNWIYWDLRKCWLFCKYHS